MKRTQKLHNETKEVRVVCNCVLTLGKLTDGDKNLLGISANDKVELHIFQTLGEKNCLFEASTLTLVYKAASGISVHY